MSKKLIIILLFVVFVAGCMPASLEEALKNLPGLPSRSGETLSLGGTTALSIEILNPSDEEAINSDYPLQPVIKVINEGGADSEGTLCIFGMDETVFPSFTGCECESYETVISDENSENYKEAVVEFPSYNINKEEATGGMVMSVSNKYSYKTKGKFEACVKKDPYSKKGCQVKSGSRSVNFLKKTTTGPVVITKVTESVKTMGETASLIFTIELEKKGEGRVINLEDYNSRNCELREDAEQEFEAKLLNVPDEGEVVCGIGKLDDKGEGRISCETEIILFDQGGNYLYEDYLPEIEVEISYTIETIKSSKFTIT